MPAQLQTLSLSRLNRLQRQELVERRMLRLVFLGLVVLSLAGLLYLTQASAVTTTTYEIQELQEEIQRLQRERDRLRAEIAVLTLPQNVEARARALGFRTSAPADFLVVREVPILTSSSAQAMVHGSPIPSPLRQVYPRPGRGSKATAQLGTGPSSPNAPPASLERFLTRAGNWVQIALSLLPAPRQVEAGPAHQ